MKPYFKMWQIIAKEFVNRAVSRVLVPVSVVLGTIGFIIESYISDKYTPPIPSVQDEREKRFEEKSMSSDSLKEKKFVPKTIFEKNLPPSLLEEDNRRKK